VKLRHKVGETGGGKSGRAPPEVRALQQEIALLEDLHHPNIVKYLGTQVLGARLYIYLSYASDGSLAAAVAKYGSFSEAIIRSYISQLLSGLAYLHSVGIIHRDIKASNVLLDKGAIQLADFGCSTTTTVFHGGGSEVRGGGRCRCRCRCRYCYCYYTEPTRLISHLFSGATVHDRHHYLHGARDDGHRLGRRVVLVDRAAQLRSEL